MELRPHDLVRINSVNDLLKGHLLNSWAINALVAAPYVVTRRANNDNYFIPVGVRGKQRGERLATWLAVASVREIITPEQLITIDNWNITDRNLLGKQLESLQQLTVLLNQFHYVWGPVGSVAFELATGIKSTNENSDLDIIIRINEPINKQKAIELLNEMERTSTCVLDIQINSQRGGFSLKEYCYSPNVLVKTNSGPFLLKSSQVWNTSLMIDETISF